MRRLVATMTLAATLALAAGAGSDRGAVAGAAAPARADVRALDLGTAQAMAVSPDGLWLATWERGDETSSEVCVLATDDLAPVRCVSLPRESVAVETATWSPDGTRLAFTEAAGRLVEDGDVWVLDRETGALANLTDDGYVGDPLTMPDLQIDEHPTWSPDGSELLFTRAESTGERTPDGAGIGRTSLLRVPATGGEPTPVATLYDNAYTNTGGLTWLADGNVIWGATGQDTASGDGVWTVPAAGGTPRQLLAFADIGPTTTAEGMEIPGADPTRTTLISVSSDAGRALVLDNLSRWYYLVDLATGESAPVMVPGDESLEPDVTAAALSPDGTTLLVAVYDPVDGPLLLARDLSTGDERVIARPEVTIGDYQPTPTSLRWVSDRLAVGTEIDGSTVLVALGGGLTRYLRAT